MSNTVDNRVVELQFDNQQFESNVKTTMSTLDKLKQSLNFKGASRGLEDIQAVANRTDFSGMSRGIETVSASFSALQVVGITTLANITNSAVNAGKNLIKSLSVDQITAGMNKYELKTQSVQTLVNSTGKSLAEINGYLDQLMWYSDETSYGFTDMTASLSQLTSAGGDIEKLIPMIEGVANATAFAGKGASEFSRVIYNLNQSYSAGYLQYTDWRSLELAGVASKQLKQTLIDTAVELGKIEKGQVSVANFSQTLKDKWADTEVIEAAFTKFSSLTQAAYEAVEAGKFETTSEAIEALSGDFDELAVRAFTSAQEAKSFTEAIDATKDAVSSGWMKTSELIFGNYEEAKVLWTDLANVLWDVFASGAEVRNALLESALGKTFTGLVESINGVLEPAMEMADSVTEVTTAVADLGTVVDDVILGKFGNGKERFDALTEAGHNWYRVQNEVNKELGCSKRYTEEQIAAQDKLLGVQTQTAKATGDTASATTSLTEAQKTQLKQLEKLSNEQLLAQNFTEEQIAALQELRDTAEKLNIPFDEFIDKLDEINGRWILIESFKDIGRAIASVFGAISGALRDVFDPIQADQIFDLIVNIKSFTASLIPTEATLEKITRTFRGLFAAIELVTTILGAGFKLAVGVLSRLLGVASSSILDVTALVGDMIYKFNEWFQNSVFISFVEMIVEGITKIIDAVRDFVEQFKLDEKLAEGWAKIAEGVSSLWTIVKAKLPKMSWPTVISNVLKLFGTNAGEVAIKISELLIKYKDWLTENTPLIGGLNKLAEIIKIVIDGIINLVDTFMQLEPVQKFLEGIGDAFGKFLDKLGGIEVGTGPFDTLANAVETTFSNINKWLETLGDSEHFGMDLVTGLVNGIISGAGMLLSAVVNLATSIITTICSVLGIHSPSVVMYGVGQNVVQGLINGIISIVSSLWSVLKDLGSGIASWVTSGTDILYNAGYELFTGFWKGISTVWKAITSFLSGVGRGIGEAFEKIDWGVVATLAGAVAAFVMFNKLLNVADKFGDAAKALTNPFKKLGGVFDAMSEGIKENMSAKALKIKAEAIQCLAVALALVVGAVVALSLCDTDKAWQGVAMIGVLAGIIAVLGGVLVGLNILLTKYGNFGNESLKGMIKSMTNVAQLAGMLVSLSVLLLAFAAAMKIISTIDEGEIHAALVAMTVFGVILIAFTALAGFKPPNTTGMAKTLVGMAAIFLIMAVVLKMLGGLSGDELRQGFVCVFAISAIIIALMALTNIIGNGKDLYDAGTMLLKIAVAMGVMALAIKTIGSMSGDDMGRAVLCLVGLTGIIAALMLATRLLNKNRGLGDVGLTLLGVASAIGILALVVKLIASTPFEQMKKGVIGIALLGLVMTMLVKATSLAGGENLKGVAATLLGMSLCIGILAGACVILGLVDPATVWKGVAAVAALGVIVGLLVYATKYASTADLKGTMIGMAVAIGVLAATILVLSFIEPKDLVAPTIAISMLLSFFALVMYATKDVSKCLGTVLAMALVIGLLAAALWLLSDIPAEQLIPIAAALTIVMAGFAGALFVLGKVAVVSKSALIGAAAMVGVVALLAVVLGALSALDVTLSIETALSLSVLLLALSGSVAILSVVGVAATAAIPGIAVVAGMVVALGALLIAIGALMKYVPEAEEFLNKGVSVLETLGKAIGSFFGGIIGGFAESATSTLPTVADNLSDFMTRLKPFLDGIKMVDESSVSAAKALADIILTLTGAGVIDAITSWLTGGNSLESFAEQLASFGEGMKSYAASVEGLNVEAIKNSVDAAKGIVEVANALPKEGGLAQAFSGYKDLSLFGEDLLSFGEGMKSYATAVEGINTEAINNSVGAAKGIVEVANALPKEGGVGQAFAGYKDLSLFGKDLVPFGEGMKSYGEAVVGVNTEAIIRSADAAEALVEVAEILPSTDGLLQWFMGEKDFGAFGKKMVPFGESMKEFGNAVVGLNADAIVNSAPAAKALTEVGEAIPAEGLFDKDYTFAEKLVPFAESAKQYAANVEGINVAAVTDSVAAGKELCDLVDRTSDVNTGGVSAFVSAMDELAGVSFDGIIAAFEGAPAALQAIGNSFVTGFAAGMEEAQSAAVASANSVVTAVANSISDGGDSFTLAGKTLVGKLASGITASLNVASTAVKTMGIAAATALLTVTTSFYTAGMNCARGFANGIAFNSYLATIKARAMARAAVNAANEELDINSPSKVFMQVGRAVPEGFAKGIDKYGYYVDNSIEGMASGALDNTKSVISRIGDALSNTDMDAQPTIRPVVDMSDVESSAANINSMFNNDLSLGARMNLNAISTSMRRRNQNGVNDDVVSAINGLRKDVGNLENNSYSLGNITFSSGDEVAQALNVLVNAARVEGRV